MRTGVTLSMIFAFAVSAGTAAAQAETAGAALPEDESASDAPADSEAGTEAGTEAEAEAEPEQPAKASGSASGGMASSGLFLRFGANAGLLAASTDTQPDTSYSGLQLGLDGMVGLPIMPTLIVGGALVIGRTAAPKAELGGQSSTLDGVSLYFYGLAGFVNYYFAPDDGLHLQGLVGYSKLHFASDRGNVGTGDPTGPFLGLGVGYDFPVAANWSVGPFGRLLWASMSKEHTNGRLTYLYPSVGVAVTMR